MALLYQKELAEDLDVDLTGALNMKVTNLFWIEVSLLRARFRNRTRERGTLWKGAE